MVCLPIADRSVSHAFYTALGFRRSVDPGEDGLPEPLQFQISTGLRLMLIPRGGFGWVIGGRDDSPSGMHEGQIVVGMPTQADVDAFLRRAREAGAQPVYEAAEQMWGYAGAFIDPDSHQWQVADADSDLTS